VTETVARPSLGALPSAAGGRRGRGGRRVRMPIVAAGAALVVLCVVGFAAVAANLGGRVAVLQVQRAVAAGQTFTSADLGQVQASDDSGLHLIPASQAGQVVGEQAALPLAAGALLTDSEIGDAVWPPAGQMTGSVALAAGRFPPDLAAGQHVTVFVRASSDTTETGSATATTPASFGAVVVSVAPAADGQGSTVVTLLLAADDAATLAGAPDDGVVVMRGTGG
jgi:hypothetical protein